MAKIESLEVARLERENKKLLSQRKKSVQEFIAGIENMPQLHDLRRYVAFLFTHATADTATYDNFWWDLIWDISFTKNTEPYLKGAFHSITLANKLTELSVSGSAVVLNFEYGLSDFDTPLWWVNERVWTLDELMKKQALFKTMMTEYLDSVENIYHASITYGGIYSSSPLRQFYTSLFLWENEIPNPIPMQWARIGDDFHVYIQFASGNLLHFWFDYYNSPTHVHGYDGFEKGVFTGQSEYI